MLSVFLQLINVLLICLLLGVPVVITVLLLRHFGKGKGKEDYLLEKIRELEERIRTLEEKE